jgi:phosphoglycolate phosphatase|tara:strand:+ start:160 stop:885 length:726 start_codon:yes stop_codon:yes gene_type:complete
MNPLKRDFDANKIKGIVFDKDGTLLDFHATWVPRALAAAKAVADGDSGLTSIMLQAAGYDNKTQRVLGGSVLAAGNNRELSLIWAPLADKPVDQVEVLLNHMFATADYGDSVAVDQLTASLQQLVGLGLVLGLATMDSEAGIKATLGDFECLHLFDYAVGYDSGFGSKPGPGMVLGFCQQTGLTPEQVMVVGDNTHDLHMGQSAAAGFNVGVLTGTSSRSELAPDADLVVASIAHLAALWH